MAQIGIDFGTTTTVGARVAGDEIEIIEDAEGRSVVPSVVAYPPTGGHLIGEEAKYRRPIDAENTIFSMKRIIGLPWSHLVVQEFIEKYPFDLQSDSRELPRFRTRAGDLEPGAVAAKLIAHVLATAAAAGDAPKVVVVGVPSDFTSQRRVATIDAVKLAGFESAVCVDEPLAIARAYLRHDLGEPRRIAVYDLGGGTFDFALCEVKQDDCVLLAAGGDQFLGGDDIDLAIAELVAVEVLQQLQWDILTAFEARTRLLSEAERAKIALNDMQSARIKLRSIENAEMFVGKDVTIERKQLDRWAFDLARRSFVVCDDAIARAGLTINDIDEVYLAGGSTRIPAVQQAVSHYFGKQPRVSDSPDHLVAIGAAVIASELAQPEVAPVSAPGIERRRDLRRKTSLRVKVRFKDLAEFQTLFAHDISEGGTFIAMVNPPKPGNELVLKIEIGEQKEIEIHAKVVRRILSARESGVSGMGVEFGDLGAAEQEALNTVLIQTAQLFGPARPRGQLATVPSGTIEK